MKVLFTALYPLYHYHFADELDYIEKHIFQGDDIWALYCEEQLQACECNRDHNRWHCGACIGIQKTGLSLLSIKIKKLRIIDSQIKDIPKFVDFQEFKDFRYDSFDAGMAAYSSLIDYTKETEPDFKIHSIHAYKLLRDGINSFITACNYLKRYKFDLVYIFNGRFSVARAWVRACQLYSVDFIIHERGGKPQKKLKIKNTFFHNINQYQEKILDFWNENPNEEFKHHEGRQFFDERIIGKHGSWYSYITEQQIGLLPFEFNKEKKNIVIFTSSEFEIKSSEGLFVENKKFPQKQTILEITNLLLNNQQNYHLYIRVHPNSISDKNRWWEDRSLSFKKNLTIINPESHISSYALLDNSSIVIVFGSTIGIEATYWGKPSILLGHSFYQGIDAVYEPNSISDVMAMISEIPTPKPIINSIKFGYFWRCCGDDSDKTELVNYYTQKFKGVTLTSDWFFADNYVKQNSNSLSSNSLIQTFKNIIQNIKLTIRQ